MELDTLLPVSVRPSPHPPRTTISLRLMAEIVLLTHSAVVEFLRRRGAACCARGRNPCENVVHLLPRDLTRLLLHSTGRVNRQDVN
jgi:hypothetical protein